MTLVFPPTPPEINEEPPQTPLRIVEVIAPTIEDISHRWPEPYPITFRTSRALTYYELLVLNDDMGRHDWTSSPGSSQVTVYGRVPVLAQSVTGLQEHMADIERGGRQRRQNERDHLRSALEATVEMNHRLSGPSR